MSSVKRKKLCVVLMTKNIPDHDEHRASFRAYAQRHQDADERVHYAYVWEDTQTQFVTRLTKGEDIVNDTSLKVAIVWRRDHEKLNYDWLEDGWPLASEDLMRSRRKLRQAVDWFLHSSQGLPMTAVLQDLIDEHQEGLLYRIGQRLIDWCDVIVEKVLSLDEVTVITMMMTVGFVFVLGYMMTTLSNIEEEKVQAKMRARQARQQPASTPPPVAQPDRPTVYVHQLHEETITQLILNSEPGVRLIVLFVDFDTKDKLLQSFAHVMLPYSRSDAFTFAFMQLEDYLYWFREMLEETLEFRRELVDIKLKNCVGTVLAVNGPRKYYCMYHAQQERQRRAKEKEEKMSNPGSFMGFESEDSTSDDDFDPYEQKLFECDLLNGLGVWMDRLCEGSLKRFRIEKWPKMDS